MLYAVRGSPPNPHTDRPMADEPFKATDEDWQRIEEVAFNYWDRGRLHLRWDRTIRELRDRVAALEAERVAPKASTTAPASPAAVPSDRVLWEVQLEAKTISRPHSGWQVWSPESEPLIAAHRALYDHGFQHGLAAGRAEQGTTPEPDAPQTLHGIALDMVDSLGRSFNLLPEILNTLRRAIREPMAEQQAAPEPNQAPAGDEEPVKASAVETLRELVEVMHDAFFGNDSELPRRVIQSVNNAHAFLFKLEHGPRLPVTACDGEAQR